MFSENRLKYFMEGQQFEGAVIASCLLFSDFLLTECDHAQGEYGRPSSKHIYAVVFALDRTILMSCVAQLDQSK